MHQDYITSSGCILDDLKRDPIDFFNTFVKPSDPRFRVARGVQVPEVRVPFQRFTELCGPSPRRRGILQKPPMHKAMRSTQNVRAATTWSDIGEHRMHFHPTRRQQPAGVIAIDVPAGAGYVPLMADRELQKEGPPITRFLPGLALQYLIDRLDHTSATDGAKSRIGFQMLQVYRPRHCPS